MRKKRVHVPFSPTGKEVGRMELLTHQELANLLKVRPGTIYSWLSRGVDIPHIRIEGTVRFRRDAIESWLLQKEKDRKRKNFEL